MCRKNFTRQVNMGLRDKRARGWVAAERNRTVAVVVGALDQDAANTLLAHFGEGDDLGRTGESGHGANHPAD
jgi:hypothetical protein